MQVLDVGSGIGGPLREIAGFRYAQIMRLLFFFLLLNFHYRDQQQWVSDFQRRSKRILLFYFEGQYSGICWHCAGRKCESFIIPGEGRRGACGRWQVRQIAAFVLVETPSDTCVLIEAASDLFLVAGRRSSHQYTSFWPESLSHVLEKVQGSAFACYRSPV
ncbi:hypothetical protein GW17_00048836 [Ensete ventricosum]|nr:hypothetical protein GW17_00048836 [Ensete ventricosum]